MSKRMMLVGGGVLVCVAMLLAWWFYSRAEKTEFPTILSGTATVVLTAEGYEPREITIRKNTTVTFRSENKSQHWPASDLHPAHEIYPEFDPGRPLESDEMWQFTFDKVGTWGLHDHIRSYYTGVVHVVE